jgi:PII-like signaling protein
VIRDGCLKLTTYFGERDRVEHRYLADALLDVYARHELRTSLLLRGVQGFGAKQHLHTDRLLTLSEDLPLVSVAVDVRERVESALPEVMALHGDGLVTLERARLVTGPLTAGAAVGDRSGGNATKLTVYVGRGERIGGRPAHRAVVDLLRRHGVAGATVLLGVDGTVHGARERARFFGANARVPLMIIAVGDHGPIAAALAELTTILRHPLATLERVRVCKRDGVLLSTPDDVPETDESGLGVWQKLMVFCGEASRHDGHPLYIELVRALRRAGAAGTTSLRGIWGYHGDHAPHGDTLWQLQRRVPVVTVLVDTPVRTRRWFELIDELTAETGLVTSETVPAFRATGPVASGGLRLARTPAA